MTDTAIDTATRDAADALRRRGYCIIPNAVPASTIEALDAELAPTFGRTPFAGAASTARRPSVSAGCSRGRTASRRWSNTG